MFFLIIPVTIEASKKKLAGDVFWELDNYGVLTISGKGYMPDFEGYKKNRAPWYSDRKKIRKVVIEEGIYSIGAEAFCSEDYTFSDIVISNTVRKIGRAAFERHKGLRTVVLPNSIEALDYLSFGWSTLTKIRLPKSLKVIPKNCFQGSKLKSIEIPNSVVSIEEEALEYCDNLTSLKVPNSVKYLGKDAFIGCRNLSSISIPNSIINIDNIKFSDFDGEILSMPEVIIKNPLKYGISEESAKLYKSSIFSKNGNLILLAKKGRKIKKINDSSVAYYLIEENYDKGVINGNGVWIIPYSKNYSEISVLGNNLIKVKKDNNYGVVTLDGKEVVPTSRGYISIGEYNNSKGTFTFTKRGYKGVCNNQGKEISLTKLALTADDLKEDMGYSKVFTMNNGNSKYYKVSKNGLYGLTDSNGREIVPCEMDALESAGTGYLKYKLNGFWGLMNYNGKILIDTDRGYTSIGDYKSFNKRFAYTMNGYKGECDATGRQISKIKVETPKQSTSVASSSSSSSSSNRSSSSSNSSGNKTTTVVVEHHRDPVPVQDWVPCSVCGHNPGVCQTCAGNGTSYSGRLCISCRGSGKCHFCNGQGGRYQIVYR